MATLLAGEVTLPLSGTGGVFSPSSNPFPTKPQTLSQQQVRLRNAACTTESKRPKERGSERRGIVGKSEIIGSKTKSSGFYIKIEGGVYQLFMLLVFFPPLAPAAHKQSDNKYL